MSNPSWFVNIDTVKTDYVVIENLEQFLSPPVPTVHPNHPEYKLFWSRESKKCIEGIWGNEWGKYRFMPGNLYFLNYTVLEHTKQNEATDYFKPSIVDYYWDFAYISLTTRGFSGFDKDEKYSSNSKLKDYLDGKLDKKYLHHTCYNSQGELKEYIEPFEYLSQLHEEPLGKPIYYNETVDNMILGSRGGGKQQPNSETVMTPDGKVTMGSLKEGDFVIGSDGLPAQVLQIHPQGVCDVYEIHLEDGRKIKCGYEHLWKVYDNKKEYVLTTGQLLSKKLKYKHKRSGYSYRFKIPNTLPVNYLEKNLPIDPYILGCLLGDGTVTTKTPKIATSDKFILNEFKRILGSSFEFNKDVNTTNNYTIVYRGDNKNRLKKDISGKFNQSNLLTNQIEELGINKKCSEKFIPDIYKYGSISQRLSLIQGLLDTDGSINKSGSIEFTNTNKTLVDDFVEVCRSLGIQCRIRINDRSEQQHSIKGHICNRSKYYRVFLRTDLEVFRLPRKKEKLQPLKNSNGVAIVDIIKLDYQEDSTCITVDNADHTYLTTEYVVTHNSYYTGLAELEYRYVFNNVKSYKEFIDPRKRKLSKQCVGSGETTKSADLLAKVKVSQDAKTRTDNAYFREIFGIWGTSEEDPEFKPCPFYRKSSGNFDCPNKRNPYRNEYKVYINGEYKPRGSGSTIFHVNYNSKKGKGAQAATGGRYDFMDYEEVGEMDNYVEAKGSNENCVKRGVRFGVQWAQGTSGNIEYIMGTKEVFLNPQDYNILSFPNKNGVEGKNGRTGYFLPNYMVLFHFKDKNGNTDFEAAIRQVNEERQKASESKDPKVLTAKLMNEPCYTHEMWLTDKGYYLPYEEAAVREKELMTNNLYKTNHVAVELYWDNSERYEVGYKVLHNAEPHINFPVPKDMKDPSGCICIYEFPTPNDDGIIPNDMYMFIGYDNYVEQNLDYGGSLGVTYVLKNPKYIPQGYTGNIIVASYIGKPAKGLDYYHEQQEKLIAMYGNPVRGLWFEKNRGEPVREYYIRKHKTHLLCLTPQRVISSNIYQQNMASYGFIVGNKIAKINLLKLVHDWLLEETTFSINNTTETKKNIQRIPCLFLLRQIMQYNLDDNFDAVSAIIGSILGLREYQNELEDKSNLKNKNKVNIFAGLLKNNKIYRNAGFAR